jgi:hypothetical protein
MNDPPFLVLSLVFLHPYAETSWDDQLTKESLVERTIRATIHARATLLAGFTTVRWVYDVVFSPRSTISIPGFFTSVKLTARTQPRGGLFITSRRQL